MSKAKKSKAKKSKTKRVAKSVAKPKSIAKKKPAKPKKPKKPKKPGTWRDRLRAGETVTGEEVLAEPRGQILDGHHRAKAGESMQRAGEQLPAGIPVFVAWTPGDRWDERNLKRGILRRYNRSGKPQVSIARVDAKGNYTGEIPDGDGRTFEPREVWPIHHEILPGESAAAYDARDQHAPSEFVGHRAEMAIVDDPDEPKPIADEPKPIAELIAASSVGQALADVKERGIDAHLADMERPKAKRAPRKPKTNAEHLTGMTVEVSNSGKSICLEVVGEYAEGGAVIPPSIVSTSPHVVEVQHDLDASKVRFESTIAAIENAEAKAIAKRDGASFADIGKSPGFKEMADQATMNEINRDVVVVHALIGTPSVVEPTALADVGDEDYIEELPEAAPVDDFGTESRARETGSSWPKDVGDPPVETSDALPWDE